MSTRLENSPTKLSGARESVNASLSLGLGPVDSRGSFQLSRLA